MAAEARVRAGSSSIVSLKLRALLSCREREAAMPVLQLSYSPQSSADRGGEYILSYLLLPPSGWQESRAQCWRVVYSRSRYLIRDRIPRNYCSLLFLKEEFLYWTVEWRNLCALILLCSAQLIVADHSTAPSDWAHSVVCNGLKTRQHVVVLVV